jgi:hypothetical protein
VEPHSRDSKTAIILGVIGLVAALALASFRIPPEWTIFFIIITIVGGIFILLLPRITKRVEFHWPIKRRTLTHEAANAIQTAIKVSDQVTLPRLATCFSETNTEICLLGITLESILQVIPQLRDLLQRCNVKMLLLNPDSELVPRYERLVDSNNLQDAIRRTITDLTEMRDNLSAVQRRNFELRIHNEIGPYSSIIIDPNNENGSMQIEPYPYNIARGHRRNFLIYGRDKTSVFKTFKDGFNNLWDVAETV